MEALPPPAPALPTRLLLLLVRGYRYWFKPWLGNACRFEPTCSAYAMEALQRHGALRGSALASWRLLRCHPWCDGGCDPVPHNPAPPAATAAAGKPPGLFTRLIDGRGDGDRAAAAPQSPTRKHP